MPALDGLEGRRFAGDPYEVGRAKVREYVEATGDDPAWYADTAPPAFAAVYAMAPALALFADPDVAAVFGRLLHTEQSFTFHRRVKPGDVVLAEGHVGRVAERFGNTIVTFAARAALADGTDLVDATSAFLIRPEGDALALSEAADPLTEGTVATAALTPDTAPGTPLGSRIRRASRADLVRYAGAGGDFNPIHWDSDHARAHGLPGVIVHGLLLFAWTVQAVTATVLEPGLLASVTGRFRGVALAGEDVAVAARVKAADGARTFVAVDAATGRGTVVTTNATVVW